MEIVMNAKPAFAASVVPSRHSFVPRAPDRGRDRDRVTSLESLDVYRVSLEACRVSAGIASSLSSNLRDQLLRASSSVVLNVAEGFGSSSRGVKRRHYEIARGSAVECIAVVDLVRVIGTALDETSTIAARELFERAAAMLAKLEARFR